MGQGSIETNVDVIRIQADLDRVTAEAESAGDEGDIDRAQVIVSCTNDNGIRSVRLYTMRKDRIMCDLFSEFASYFSTTIKCCHS